MHEIGITRNLVEIAEQHARSGGHNRVLSVSVDIGELSGVVAEAVEFCFEVVSRDTLLEGSRLIINRISAKMSCRECEQNFHADNYTFECPLCGGFRLDLVQGDELRITEMEVE
jgi:hydrogenase nickel incorporation protein HypA/HybF